MNKITFERDISEEWDLCFGRDRKLECSEEEQMSEDVSLTGEISQHIR